MPAKTPLPAKTPRPLRLLTYNVHRCLGVDGRLSPERIAEVIQACRPDVVALQELDAGRLRTGGVDQADRLAGILGMGLHFHPAMRVENELYGDALLARMPLRLVRAGPLPALAGARHAEPRGAIWAAVEHDGAELQVLTTHLGLDRRERLLQAQALLGEDWMGHPSCRGPAVLLGDLNALPASTAHRAFAAVLGDAQRRVGGRASTFPSRLPVLRLDYVFVTPGVTVQSCAPVRTPLSRVASDHLPLLAEITLDDRHHSRPHAHA